MQNPILYLAKIYNHEENQRKEEYNLDTALLIEPNNEEVILMLMKIALKKSNYSKVKDLSQTFVQKFVKYYVMKMMKFKSLLKI